MLLPLPSLTLPIMGVDKFSGMYLISQSLALRLQFFVFDDVIFIKHFRVIFLICEKSIFKESDNRRARQDVSVKTLPRRNGDTAYQVCPYEPDIVADIKWQGKLNHYSGRISYYGTTEELMMSALEKVER